MNQTNPLENVPARLAVAAASLVGAALALDDSIESLQRLFSSLPNGEHDNLESELQKAVEITNSIAVLHHKSKLACHVLTTSLIRDLIAKQ